MATLTIDVSDEFYEYFKTFTARKKKAIVDCAKAAIYTKAEEQKVPNAKTLKVLEDSDNGIGLNEYSSWQEMVEKLQREMEEEARAAH